MEKFGPGPQRRSIIHAWRTAFLFASLLTVVPGGPAAAQGLVLEDPVEYRSFRAVPRFRSYLPPRADLSAFFPTPGQQGAQGSCTGWAIGYALRTYYERKAMPTGSVPNDLGFSPAFLYNQIKIDPADCDSGALISKTLKFLKAHGVAPMPNFPYSETDCSGQPDEKATAIAANFKIDSWQRVDFTTEDDVKGELAAGHPVVVGLYIPEAFLDWKGDAVFDQLANKDTDFGHALVVVGYDDKKGAFKVINSWGTQWGQNGFGWISYNAFTHNTAGAFSVRVRQAPLTLASFFPKPRPHATTPPAVVTPQVVPPPSATRRDAAPGKEARP